MDDDGTPVGAAERSPSFEKWLAIGVLVVMASLPLLEILGRSLLGRGVSGSIPLVQHLTLWLTFVGAGLAARSERLLALATTDVLPERWRARADLFTSTVAVAATATLAFGGLELVEVEREAGSGLAWGIPLWAALLVMPVGLGLVGVRIAAAAAERRGWRLLVACGGLVPLALYGFPGLRTVPAIFGTAMGLLVAAAVLGLPIFALLGGAAALMFWTEDIPIAAVSTEMYRLAAQPMLPAVPLFTLGGCLLAEGGASQRLLRAFAALFGWMPGGLAIVSVVVLAFFTPLTGASGVTILSVGGLLFPVLVKARYPERTALGLVTVSGSIGLLFAPSLPVILYGVYAHVPIDELFVGGALPGILLVVGVAAYGVAQGLVSGADRPAFRWREALAALWGAKWELALPAGVVIAIFGGYATLVEASALTVVYALVVECLVFRDLDLRRDVTRVFVESATLVGGFLIILGAALGFTNYLIQAEIPIRTLELVRSQIDSPLVFLLALNLLLIVVGALMDIYSAIFVLVPLIAPLGAAYGIDPVHLGVVFLSNMELGYLMPPMGENLFLSSYRFRRPLAKVYAATWPYVLILLVVVLLVTYVPALTLAPLGLYRAR